MKCNREVLEKVAINVFISQLVLILSIIASFFISSRPLHTIFGILNEIGITGPLYASTLALSATIITSFILDIKNEITNYSVKKDTRTMMNFLYIILISVFLSTVTRFSVIIYSWVNLLFQFIIYGTTLYFYYKITLETTKRKDAHDQEYKTMKDKYSENDREASHLVETTNAVTETKQGVML